MTSYQNFIKDYAKNNNLKYRDAQKIVKEQALFKTKSKTEESKADSKADSKIVKTIKVPKDSVINIYMTQNNNPTPIHTVTSKDGIDHHNIVMPNIPNIPVSPIELKEESPQEKLARQEKTRIAREEAKERNKPKELSPQEKNMNALLQAIAKRKVLSEQKGAGYNPCWDGYIKKGTKIKNGKRVNNCVPA